LQKGEKKPPKKDQKNKPAIFSDWAINLKSAFNKNKTRERERNY
jgi:hypothetical protein